jgi:hypothetical protein
MLGNNATVPAVGRFVRLAAALVSGALAVGVSASLAAADSRGDSAAVWVHKELNFRYVGFTTKYSCDGLRDKMRRVLLDLGARDDLKVTGYACIRVDSPETTPGVRIAMDVLQPASATARQTTGQTAGQTVAAHWKTVDLLADRNLVDAGLDCELVAQLHRDVVPLFATRHVDYSAACSVNNPLIGGTRLKADVLVAN